LLRHVLWTAAECPDVRNLMVYALAAVEAELPLDELEQLLGDAEIHLGAALCLCRTDAARELGRAALIERVRTYAAEGYGTPFTALEAGYPAHGFLRHPVRLSVPDEFRRLETELCEEYVAAYRSRPAEDDADLDLLLARCRPNLPDSRAVFLDRWRQAGDAEARRRLLWICPHPSAMAEWLAAAPPTVGEVLSRPGFYHLPLGALARIIVEQYGLDEVLLYIEGQFRAASRGGDEAAHYAAMEAEWFLREQPDELTTERVVSLLGCPDIYHSLKNYLRRAYIERIWVLHPNRRRLR
jgi:hypothetical protein